jgi:hypothetical protein
MPTDEIRGELSLPQKRIVYGFDEAAKGLAASTISRRRALKLAGSALLSGGLLALFPGVASAQVSVQRRGCARKRTINNMRCPSTTCGGNINCNCATTVSGEKRCVNLRNAVCPSQDECDRDRDCARGEVCLRVGGCCGHPARNDCRPLCS